MDKSKYGYQPIRSAWTGTALDLSFSLLPLIHEKKIRLRKKKKKPTKKMKENFLETKVHVMSKNNPIIMKGLYEALGMTEDDVKNFEKFQHKKEKIKEMAKKKVRRKK